MTMMGGARGPRFSKIADGMAGAWQNGQTLLKGIGKIMPGDFCRLPDPRMAAIGLVKSAWGALEGLFGSGGGHANDARDQFLAQFGGGHDLAALLTSLGAGEGGGGLYSALVGA